MLYISLKILIESHLYLLVSESMWNCLRRVRFRGWREDVDFHSMLKEHKYKDSIFFSNRKLLEQHKETNNDHFTVLLTKNGNPHLFQKVTKKLWQFEYFTPQVMHIYSTFQQDKRSMKEGDLICERIFFIPWLFETVVINRVEKIIDTESMKGFSLDSTDVHDEIGRLSCTVEFKPTSGELLLHVHATCLFKVPFFRKFSRFLQKRAHNKAIQAFKDFVAAEECQVLK